MPPGGMRQPARRDVHHGLVLADARRDLRTRTVPARVLVGLVAVIVVATAAGVVTVWPRHLHHATDVMLDRAHGDDRVALVLVLALALVALSATSPTLSLTFAEA